MVSLYLLRGKETKLFCLFVVVVVVVGDDFYIYRLTERCFP